MTWVGAAAFAAWHGARLPTRIELIKLTSWTFQPPQPTRITGSAMPSAVTEPGRHAREIHHLLGNLQVAASRRSGSRPASWRPCWPAGCTAQRGTLPPTEEEVRRLRHRHLPWLLPWRRYSPGPRRHPAPDRTSDILASWLSAWIARLADRSQSLAELDEWLIRRAGWLTGRCWPWDPCSCQRRGNLRWLAHRTGSLKPSVGRSASFTNSTPRIGRVSAPTVTSPIVPPSAAGLEGEVNDVSPVAGQVIADVQQAAGLDVQAGLLLHLPHQGSGQGLAFLDLAAGQAPRPARYRCPGSATGCGRLR